MEHASGNSAQADTAATAIDPVCGMNVDLAAGKPTFRHDGTDYHFCDQGCCDKFAADPEHYLSGAHRRGLEEAPAGTRFTCPMHREVVQDGPGVGGAAARFRIFEPQRQRGTEKQRKMVSLAP